MTLICNSSQTIFVTSINIFQCPSPSCLPSASPADPPRPLAGGWFSGTRDNINKPQYSSKQIPHSLRLTPQFTPFVNSQQFPWIHYSPCWIAPPIHLPSLPPVLWASSPRWGTHRSKTSTTSWSTSPTARGARPTDTATATWTVIVAGMNQPHIYLLTLVWICYATLPAWIHFADCEHMLTITYSRQWVVSMW